MTERGDTMRYAKLCGAVLLVLVSTTSGVLVQGADPEKSLAAVQRILPDADAYRLIRQTNDKWSASAGGYVAPRVADASYTELKVFEAAACDQRYPDLWGKCIGLLSNARGLGAAFSADLSDRFCRGGRPGEVDCRIAG